MKKQRKKVNTENTLIFALCLIFMVCIWNLLSYPEKYFTTWKFQLYNDIEAGNEEAIEYYQTKYIKNGIKLFEE